VAQIYLKDANGQTYFARGMYAQAPVNGQMTVEIQYWPNAEVEERCLQKHDRVTKNVMDNTKPDQRRFGYLFLVPPGTKIESLHAGGMRGQSQPTPLDVP
jgi:hypothetical protein